MGVTYNIAAKPTFYDGIRFRSRLEATWAAFFDLCRWRWEYEPLDLKGWVPDFVLHGARDPVAVEVKPIWQWKDFPAVSLEKIDQSGWSGEVLVLGNGLIEDQFKRPAIGWLAEWATVDGEPSRQWGRASFGNWPENPEDGLDFCHDVMSYFGRLTSNQDQNPCSCSSVYAKYLWTASSNKTAWRR